MAIELVFETHSTTVDNEQGHATGWLPGQLSDRGRTQAQQTVARSRSQGAEPHCRHYTVVVAISKGATASGLYLGFSPLLGQSSSSSTVKSYSACPLPNAGYESDRKTFP